MKCNTKKIISVVLTIAMLMGLVVFPATAANSLAYEVSVSDDSVTNDVENTVTVSLALESALDVCSLGFVVSVPSELELVSIEAAADSEFSYKVNLSTGRAGWDGDEADNGVDFVEYSVKEFAVVTVKIPAGTEAGEYTVTISDIEIYADNADTEHSTSDEVSATITVTAPEQGGGDDDDTTAAGYEIYYTLSGTTFSGTGDTDSYTDYNIGDTVIADIFMISNNVDVTVQAYDIYLSYDPNELSYKSETLAGTAYKTDASATTNDAVVAAEGDTVTHIQLVKDTTTVALTKGVAQSLGTITFEIDPDVTYGQELEFSLAVAADTTNTAKAENVTNFSIGGAVTGTEANGEGDSTSYYPVDTSAVDGAEVMSQYTVSFDTDGGSAVADQTVGYNLTATKPATDPTKDNYTFKGWYEDEDLATEFDFATKITEDTTVYAKWEKNVFKVYWHDVDGDVIETDENVVSGSAPVFDGTNPEKTDTNEFDYTFLGWNTDSTATTALTLSEQKITADTHYYPIFSSAKQTYTVIWYNQDGTTALETDSDVEFGTAPTFDSEIPTKDAGEQYTYTFAGWATSANQESGTEEEDLPTVDGNEAYYATFSKSVNKYTVTYAAGDHGSLAGETIETVEYGKNPASVPNVTADAGYTFTGWYDTTNGAAVSDISAYVVKGDVTLTAQYEPKSYTVTFKANGGTGIDYTQTFTFGTAQNLTANSFTAPEGYTFAGWNTVQNPTTENPGTVYADAASFDLETYAENVELYAQWSANPYTVGTSFDNSKGTVSVANADGVSGTSATINDTINVEVSAKPGYSIDTVSYYKTSDTAKTPIGTISVDENGKGTFTMPAYDVTVTADFKAIDLTVVVEKTGTGSAGIVEDDGTATKKEDAHVGEAIYLKVVPGTGYTLGSVTYVETGNDTATAENATAGADNTYTFTMPAYNVTVKVVFEAISYNIVYDSNSGTGNMNPTSAVYDTDVTLSKNVFTKTGYTFLGWSTDPYASTATYTDEQKVRNLSSNGSDVTLYAIWQANTDTKYVVNHYKQDVVNNELQTTYTLADTENLAGTSDTDVTPAVKSYEGFIAPDTQTVTINAGGTTVMDYYYERNTYTITLDANYDEGSDSSLTVIYGSTYDDLDDPDSRNGYTFVGWFTEATGGTQVNKTDTVGVVAEDTTLYAHWTAIEYTITFELNGGVWPTGVSYTNNELAYTIESTDTLPTAEKANYTFRAWKVTCADGVEIGNWGNNTAEINANTAITGHYGDVTLTAQWNRNTAPEVEEYKYVGSGYWMLRVAATSLTDKQEYKFDGVSMYYIDDENYKVGECSKVFYTLIPATYIEDGELTEAGYNKLSIETCTARSTITYGGDINGDGVVNIADANVVYQMVVNGGAYYGNLTIEQRLAADMVKAETNAVHRGSIEDVNAIVNIINGVSTT